MTSGADPNPRFARRCQQRAEALERLIRAGGPGRGCAKLLGVKVNYETDVMDIRWEGDRAVLSCSPCGEACAVEEAEADASRAVVIRTSDRRARRLGAASH